MNWILFHWYVFGAAISIAIIVVQEIVVRRRFRKLHQELAAQRLAYKMLLATVENLKGFLERGETLRKVMIPLVKRSS